MELVLPVEVVEVELVLVLPVEELEPVPIVEVEPVPLALMVVVVVVVVTVVFPLTHFPPERISPSLLEQLLQPTPPSLKVKEKVPGGQAETHSLPLRTRLLPQLRQASEVGTPTTTYTREKWLQTTELETERTKSSSMLEVKSMAPSLVRESRLRPRMR